MNKEQLLADDYCPDCAKELDTGYECNGCGKDWLPEIQELYRKYDVEENVVDLRIAINAHAKEN